MTKKILFGLALVASVAACTDDYKDWGEPQVIAQPTVATFGNGSIASVGTIDLNALAEGQDSVQVCTITAPSASNSAFSPVYVINFGDKTFELDQQGRIAVADLQQYISDNYGRNPNITRTLGATVQMWVNDGTTSIKLAESDPFEVNAIAQAPYIDPEGYYIVGNIDEWKCVKVDEWHLVNNGGDVYENPVFTYVLPAVEGIETYEIKFIPASDFNEDGTISTWDHALSAPKDVDEVAYSGMFSYDNSGGNIKFAAEEGALYYNITLNLLDGKYYVDPVSFKPYIYFIGATDGWKASEQKLASPNGDGIYTGYCYVADPNGWGLAFKFQTTAGSWDNEINANTFKTMEGATGTNNIEVTEEGVYYMEVNLVDASIKVVKVETMGIIGAFNGWGDDVQMIWNADDYCYEATEVGVTADGWKFRVNNGWDINLGGNDDVKPSMVIDDLVGGGQDLGVVGSTIKLYPTRKTSDKIYCTVE